MYYTFRRKKVGDNLADLLCETPMFGAGAVFDDRGQITRHRYAFAGGGGFGGHGLKCKRGWNPRWWLHGVGVDLGHFPYMFRWFVVDDAIGVQQHPFVSNAFLQSVVMVSVLAIRAASDSGQHSLGHIVKHSTKSELVVVGDIFEVHCA